jgi:hypothetical protein
MSDVVQKPAFFESWDIVRRAIYTQVAEAKRLYGSEAQSILTDEQPERTIVIRINGRRRGAVVQASISLTGDRIVITVQSDRPYGIFKNNTQVIEIKTEADRTIYVHDYESLTDPHQVAAFILIPIYDCFRAAA